MPEFSGTPGGAYSAGAGLTLDGGTGEIILASSIPGTYTVTYTVAANAGCIQYQATASISVSDPPAATITYTGSPYCSSAGIVSATLTGTTGGTYSSTAGLVINASTGAISTNTSEDGTYTVTYTIAAANGCGMVTSTSIITINMLPSAAISYAGGPFCNLPGIAVVSLTGTIDGTYSSTAGLVIDAATGEINTGTSTPGIYLVTYTVDAKGGCGQYITNTTVTLNLAGSWTGTVSTDWHDAQNWVCELIPINTTDVTISGSLPNYPILNSVLGTAHNITILNGASLTIVDATLQIAGSISNSGIFDASAGDIELNGMSAQTIPAGQFSGNIVKSLTINNSNGVTLGGIINVTDVINVSNGSLASNGYLILKSTSAATARVAPITSAAAIPIIGDVTVERYVIGRRKYRLITSSVTTHTNAVLVNGEESFSIWGNWQNKANNVTPYTGTYITGGTNSDGFDTQTGNASLYTYNDVTAKFVAFSTGNGKNTRYTSLKAGIAYYMFVYGDRTKSVSTSTPNNTVLSATGTLLTGDQTYNTVSPIPISGVMDRFTLLGNPFASPINWSSIPKTDISNTYWGWDPNLNSTGGYITVSTIGTVTLTAPFSGNTGLNQYIQSGQGFFVKTTGTVPSLIIREQDKSPTFNAIAFKATPVKRRISSPASSGNEQMLGVSGTPGNINVIPTVSSLLAVNLQYSIAGSKTLADGVITVFGPDFTNQPGKEDASKMVNTAENISIANAGNNLSIDARQMPVSTDTIFLNLSGLIKTQYTLQIFADQSGSSFLQPWLQDNYLNTIQPLSLNDTNNIIFDVNSAVPSSALNRFRIVFNPPGLILPVKLISIHGIRIGKDIRIDWKSSPQMGTGYYGIERSYNGTDFITVGKVPASAANRSGSYQWLDKDVMAGNLYYRVRAIDEDGKYLLSETVMINISRQNSIIKVFPNPVTNKRLNISADMLEKGSYTLELTNTLGAVFIHLIIDHPGGMFKRNIHLDKMPFAGIYFLRLQSDKMKFSQSVMVE